MAVTAAAEEAALIRQEAGVEPGTAVQPRRLPSRRAAKWAGLGVTLLAVAGAAAWCRGSKEQPVASAPPGIQATVLTEAADAEREASAYIKDAVSIKHDADTELKQAKADSKEANEAALAEKKRKFEEAEKVLKAARTEAEHQLAAAKAEAHKKLMDSQADVDAKMDKAQAAVDKAHHAVADHRMCVDLPGTKLKDTKPIKVKPIVGKLDTGTPLKCRIFCQQHSNCRQTVFVADTKGCYLFSEATEEPVAFRDGKYNSSYCGELDEKHKMIAQIKKVFKAKPYVPPRRECSWAGDDCSKSKCCANVPVPNWDFTKFAWYTCFAKDKYFAACQKGPAPGGWKGTILGHMGTREVPKAPEGVLVQPATLYCIAIVMWSAGPSKGFWDSEGMLANNYKTKGLSIMQCDAHDFIDGAPLNGGGDGSSINNIDSFIQAWNKVRDMGKFLNYGWTVKVDSDAVFFPERLKWHLGMLRTPAGSRVYLKNTNFKFHFMGALEVISREALEMYYDKNGICAGKVGHQGGEDYYMKSCMDGIGIDHQTDFDLLNDKYAAQGNCNDDWAVAFHFYKKVSSWNNCHTAAQNAWNAKHPAKKR